MISKILFFIFIYLIIQIIYNKLKIFFINNDKNSKKEKNKIIDVDFEEIE